MGATCRCQFFWQDWHWPEELVDQILGRPPPIAVKNLITSFSCHPETKFWGGFYHFELWNFVFLCVCGFWVGSTPETHDPSQPNSHINILGETTARVQGIHQRSAQESWKKKEFLQKVGGFCPKSRKTRRTFPKKLEKAGRFFTK